jgi:hypothetical protein
MAFRYFDLICVEQPRRKHLHKQVVVSACLSMCTTGSTQRISIAIPCTVLHEAEIQLNDFTSSSDHKTHSVQAVN